MASKTRRRFALVLGSTCFAFLLAEIGFRVKAWYDDRGILDAAIERTRDKAKQFKRGERVVFESVIEPSRHDDIIYRFLPNLDACWIRHVKMPLTTNSRGFRSPEVLVDKPAGTTRIVGLGDSVLFGWRLPEHRDALSQLVALLRQRYPKREWDHVNTGVPGYNTVMQVATLRESALDLAPDLVLLSLVGNDIQLPNFIRDPRNYYSLSESFLVTFVRERLRPPQGDMVVAPGSLEPAPPAKDGAGFERDPENVPSAYRHLVGWDVFHGALDELAALSKKHDFRVVAYVFQDQWDAERRMLKAAKERGFTTLSLTPRLQQWLDERGLKHYGASPLVVKKWDPHPSSIANGIAAQAIFESLEQAGWLTKRSQ